MIEIPQEYKNRIFKGVFVFLVILCVFFVAKIISELSSVDKEQNSNQNVITLTGHGEVTAVPDIASINFTIRKEAKTIKEAEDNVAGVEKKVLEFLKTSNVADKDIKTENVSFNPKYEYKYLSCLPSGFCPGGKNVVVGYESSESITVKIRNIDDSGKIVEGLSALEITELSGPNFTIDNEDGLKAEARKKAINDARTKARVLASDLGVRLGKIASFGESENYPRPMYAKEMRMDDVSVGSLPAELPKGENTISSDVTITYEIR